MKKYIVNCGSATKECFNANLDLLDIATGIDILEVDHLTNIAIVEIKENRIVETLRKIFEMSDIVEFYELTE